MRDGVHVPPVAVRTRGRAWARPTPGSLCDYFLLKKSALGSRGHEPTGRSPEPYALSLDTRWRATQLDDIASQRERSLKAESEILRYRKAVRGKVVLVEVAEMRNLQWMTASSVAQAIRMY